MSEKDFRRFMLIFLGNFVIIGILVTLLILGANGILPDIFRKIGLILLIADALIYGKVIGRMAKKAGFSSKKKKIRFK